MTPAAEMSSRLAAWRTPRDSIGIVALGQAGFAIRSQKALVLIDPFLSPRADRLSDAVVDPSLLQGVDTILATHEHGDHLDLPAWQSLAVAAPAASFIVPEPLVGLVTDVGIARERVIGARLGVPIERNGLRSIAVPACHAVRVQDGYSIGLAHQGSAPRFVGYVIDIDGIVIYHAGDTLRHESLYAVVSALTPEIALLPINGRDAEREGRGVVGNMSPDEAAGLACDLGVTLAIPMHFDLIRGNLGKPDAFVRAMRRRNPRASVWVAGRAGALVWPARSRSWQPAGVPA